MKMKINWKALLAATIVGVGIGAAHHFFAPKGLVFALIAFAAAGLASYLVGDMTEDKYAADTKTYGNPAPAAPAAK